MTETDREGLDALPISIFMQLEEACSRFEDAWRSAPTCGSSPRIEDYVAPSREKTEKEPDHAPQDSGTSGPQRGATLSRLRPAIERELVRIDIAYRHRAGDVPRAEEYLNRFPGLDQDWLAGALVAPVWEAQPSPTKTETPNEAEQLTPAPVAPVLRLPVRCGDYELLEEIARGGMGVVYKARQLSLERIVALKMIRPGLPLSQDAVARLHREARAAGALDHPNIVAVHASGDYEGRPYFTMPYVEGNNLRVVVHRAGLPRPWQVVEWVAAVADAVACAHRQGIIHRDLKPENVLIDSQGRPRVTDFGLACRPEAGTDSERLTRMGEVLGTPAYMSPEQAQGIDELGPATDIYSLGGILYFLLTRQPPFNGRSMSDVLFQVRTERPLPPRERNPQAIPELEAICLRCLEKEPAARYPSAEALAAALRAALPAVLAKGEGGANLSSSPGPPQATGSRPELAIEKDSASARLNPPRPLEAPRPSAPDSRRFRIAMGGFASWTMFGLAAAVVVGLVVGVWLAVGPPSPKPAGPEDALPVSEADLVPPAKLRSGFGLTVAMLAEDGSVLKPGADGIIALRDGEEVKFRIKAARGAYVGIWSVNRDHTITQLFPNDGEKRHDFNQDEELVVPRTRAVSYVAKEKGDFEWVWIQAWTERWDPERGRQKGPWRLFQDKQERRQWRTDRERGPRGIGLEPDRGATVAEVVLKYRVVPR